MVRRMYLTIALLLVISTGLLLLLLGGAVYRELKSELTREGEQALQMQADPIHDAIRDAQMVQHPPDEGDIHDERGQYVYFYAKTPRGIVHSTKSPIPYRVLASAMKGHIFSRFSYSGQHYRVYAFKTEYAGARDQAYAYSLTTEERSVLNHVESLMWIVGGVGFVLALIGNLILARRLVQPTLKTWTAYRETVLELSHELQTPLATVKAMMISRNVEVSTARDVQHEIDRASQMVSDMLYLSRLRSGVKERETQPVAVSDITEEVADRFRALASEQGVQLVGTAQPGLFVETTSGEWERLVSTLFKNVIDHASSDAPATWHMASNGRLVRLVVENSVPAAKRKQARSPERGVGLQIVARLASRMHGSVHSQRENNHFRIVVQVASRRRRW